MSVPTLDLYQQFMAANEAEEALAASGLHPADRVADAIVDRISNTKRFASLQARAALAGIALHRIDGDNGRPLYIATIDAVTVRLADLDVAEGWIDLAFGLEQGIH